VKGDLAAEVTAIVADLPGARRTSGDGGSTWSLGDRPFAVLGTSGIEIRLSPPIAAAASRTPDAAPSGRGPEWVRFNPHELDGHALDRLRAWLELACRLAPG
jgi:hypothetical protein